MTVSRAVASSPLGVRPATPVDLSEIVKLLEAAELPVGEVAEHLHNVLVGEIWGTVVAVAGLEVFGPVGLVRSVVVRPDHRSGGRGGEIVGAVLGRADTLGLTELFLMTTTTAAFFEQFGFRVVPREVAPRPIQRTQEFSTLCPSWAVMMRRAV